MSLKFSNSFQFVMPEISGTFSEILNHVINCDEFNYILNLLELICSLTDIIFNNTNVLDKS